MADLKRIFAQCAWSMLMIGEGLVELLGRSSEIVELSWGSVKVRVWMDEDEERKEEEG
jgi:hypothetical protein